MHPSQTLQIIHISGDDGNKLLYQGPVPKVPAAFLSHIVVLRWSPITAKDGADNIPWLLLSDGSRLVVLNPEGLLSTDLGASDIRSPIAADYQLGDQLGKLAYADFVLGRDHVIVLFEVSGSAAMLSTSRAERDDLVNVKFPSSRAIVRSHNLRSVLVLQRTKGQDQATLLGVSEGCIAIQSSFILPTSDAQGAIFSPNQDPVLAVWDSAAHGMGVYFFSSMGHPLKQLSVTSLAPSSGLEGLGVSKLRWAANLEDTVLAIADGHKQVMIRRQNNRNMSTEDHEILRHPNTIDGAKSIVWQQMEGDDFSLQKGAFDAVSDPEAGGEMSAVELNADQTFVATTPCDNPKSVWLWQPEHPDPHTIIVLRDPVRQLLWHPRNADVLVVTTATKTPRIFVWYMESKPPLGCNIPLTNAVSSKFEGAWLHPDRAGRHAFVMTTPRAINVGHLGEQNGEVGFQSLLQEDIFGLDLDGDTSELSTPSKPSRKPPIDTSGAW